MIQRIQIYKNYLEETIFMCLSVSSQWGRGGGGRRRGIGWDLTFSVKFPTPGQIDREIDPLYLITLAYSTM